MNQHITRRSAIRTIAGSAAAIGAASLTSPLTHAAENTVAKRKGNIHHSVCKWCYEKISLEDMCVASKRLGIESIELLGVNEWPTLKKHGLVCAMCVAPGNSIENGFNRLENHDKLVAGYEKFIPEAANYGYPNIICFSGNRAGMSDEKGLENCVIGIKRIAKLAEKHKVTINIELLNSKVDHKDYMCDHTAFGVEVVKRVGSEYFKLLYDIYHAQIMEGDIIRTIKESAPYIGHYHTGGNPGRHEIDNTQEIAYPAIMKAIVATGYKGFVAQEFISVRNPLASLGEAIDLCDV